MRFPCVCSELTSPHPPPWHMHRHTHLGWLINGQCRGTAVRTRTMIPDHTDWNRSWILRRRWFPCSHSVGTTSAQSAPHWSCAALQGLKVWEQHQINAATKRTARVPTLLLYRVWIWRVSDNDSLLCRLKGSAVVDRVKNDWLLIHFFHLKWEQLK